MPQRSFLFLSIPLRKSDGLARPYASRYGLSNFGLNVRTGSCEKTKALPRRHGEHGEGAWINTGFFSVFSVSPWCAFNDSHGPGVFLLVSPIRIRQTAGERLLGGNAKELREILPICMYCKKIRDKQC